MPGIDIIVSAKDKASAVLESVGKKGSQAGGWLEKNWIKVGVATAAVGAGMEALARKQAPLTEQTRKLSASLEMQEEELRELAIATSNVTFPLEDVLDLMELGRQQGIKSAEALEEYSTFWDMVGDATGENAVALGEAGIALRAVGIAAGEEGEALESFGYISQETTGSVREFLTFLQRTGPELRDLGIDINDSAALLGLLEQELGMSGRVARTEFRTAVTESNGDLDKMFEILGVTTEQFEKYRAKVSESSGVIERNAGIHAESYTVIQKLQHWTSELTYKYGDLIQSASALTPVLIALGPIIKGLTVAKTALTAATMKLQAAQLGWIAVLGKIAGGVGGVLLALVQTGDSIQKTGDIAQQFSVILYDSYKAMQSAEKAGHGLAQGNKELWTENNNLLKSIQDLSSEYPSIMESVIELDEQYRNSELTVEEYNQKLQELVDGMASKDEATLKANEIIAEQTELLLEQGYTEEAAIEQAILYAETMGHVVEKGEELTEEMQAEIEALIDLGLTREEATEIVKEGGTAYEVYQQQVDEATASLEAHRQKVDELLTTMFNQFNLAQNVTEATWAYEDAIAELVKMEGEGITSGRDYEKVMFDVQDARERLMGKIKEEYQEEGTSIERKRELREQYVGLGEDAVASGETTEGAFKNMLTEFDDLAGGVKEDVEGPNGMLYQFDSVGQGFEETGGDIKKEVDGEINPSFEDMLGKMEDVDNYTVEPTIDANIDPLRRKVEEAQRLINSIKGKTVSINVPGASRGMFIGAQTGLYSRGGGAQPVIIHPPEIILNPEQAMNLVWNMANMARSADGGGGRSINMENNFSIVSPTPLSEAEIISEEELMLRKVGMEMGL